MAENTILKPNSILIIDDEDNMRHMLSALLNKHGYLVEDAANAQEALEAVKEKNYEFILCDVRMPDVDGLQFLRLASQDITCSTVIMMSAYGSVDMALNAMKAGAYDFISKPFKTDEVLLTLKKAEEREQLKKENEHLKSQLKRRSSDDGFENIIGENKGLKSVVDLAKKVAFYDTTVLITGESGTGKELIARGIHTNSSRKNKRFVAVNCGSIPSDLLESELFGYMRGAFTGANSNKKGLFEEAHGSTLFLDEIGELPLLMQVKLLRVLQENEIRPVGATAEKKIDVRIIAATANDIEENVVIGRFREDLFYRLNVLSIVMPPLRRRPDDIPKLCVHFLSKYNTKLGCDIKNITPSAMNALYRYRWPGNVRELENIIQRGCVLAENKIIDVENLPAALVESENNNVTSGMDYQGFSLKDAQKQLEAKMIRKALEETSGNKSKAAILLEISYPSLLNKIKEYC